MILTEILKLNDSHNSNINHDMKLRVIFLITRIMVVNNNNDNNSSYDDKLINENTNDSYNWKW